tara:strand:+ start:1893 stop:2114 length:222 start_codon:yes stop_codon:yes gene_type:complete
MQKTEAIKICSRLRKEATAFLSSMEVARLTEAQYDEIKRLHDLLDEACERSDVDEANRLRRLMADIVHEGPPA